MLCKAWVFINICRWKDAITGLYCYCHRTILKERSLYSRNTPSKQQYIATQCYFIALKGFTKSWGDTGPRHCNRYITSTGRRSCNDSLLYGTRSQNSLAQWAVPQKKRAYKSIESDREHTCCCFISHFRHLNIHCVSKVESTTSLRHISSQK